MDGLLIALFGAKMDSFWSFRSFAGIYILIIVICYAAFVYRRSLCGIEKRRIDNLYATCYNWDVKKADAYYFFTYKVFRIRISMDILHAPIYHGRPENCNGRMEKEVRTYDLLMMPGEKKFQTKLVSRQLGVSRLSFAPEKFLPAVQHDVIYVD